MAWPDIAALRLHKLGIPPSSEILMPKSWRRLGDGLLIMVALSVKFGQVSARIDETAATPSDQRRDRQLRVGSGLSAHCMYPVREKREAPVYRPGLGVTAGRLGIGDGVTGGIIPCISRIVSLICSSSSAISCLSSGDSLLSNCSIFDITLDI